MSNGCQLGRTMGGLNVVTETVLSFCMVGEKIFALTCRALGVGFLKRQTVMILIG